MGRQRRFPLGLFSVSVFAFVILVKSDDSCSLEIENTLKTLLTPQEYPSIQLQALRKDVLRKFQDALERAIEEDDLNYKRSMNSLARWDNLPHKRNLEALARAGYLKTLPDEQEEDEDQTDTDLKRSLANLAKNNQLPIKQQEDAENQAENSKRGIQSLARNGELQHTQELREFLEDLYDKRNVGSLARNFNLPSYGKRYIGSLARGGYLGKVKKNVASLARDGVFGSGKRNAAALLRNDRYLNDVNEFSTPSEIESENKRSIASVKAQYKPKDKRSVPRRVKRQVDYYLEDGNEFASPVYQNQNVYDYEDLLKELTGAYPNTDKRFLGSVAKTGWFQSPISSSSFTRNRVPDKRHIGSLARAGWLPNIRSVRRFNRSGRSMSDDICRETTTDGQNENDTISDDPIPIDYKRYLLLPAVDRILLRKLLLQSKSNKL